MALFTLKLTDNVENVDFISSGVYYVANGGFDISLPRVKRELVQIRPDFYVPVVHDFEYREAKLRFEIRGNTRSNVISALNAIERILKNVAARKRLSNGRRAELSYTWEGSNNITYFEVYGGELSLPSDALSVEKVHMLSNNQYVMPEIELTLYLSAMGYAVSIYSDALTEVPLYNPTVGAKQTGGVAVQNPGAGQYNYVEIAAVDLPGSQPLLTRIQLASGTPYSAWSLLYMGLQQSPFPSKTVFDSAELVQIKGGSVVNDAAANGGSYRTYNYPSSSPWYGAFSDWAWSVTNSSAGVFFSFLHAFNSLPTNLQFAIGIDDFVTYGIRYKEEYTISQVFDAKSMPLGAIQLPPTDIELVNYGTLHSNLWMGLFVAGESPATFTLDYLSLLPMAGGLRIWRARSTALTGTMYDDSWRGLQYLKDGSNNVYTPFYGLMEPLKLEANVTQRIYFTSIGNQLAQNERQRQFVARVYVVPTYSTLAL